MFFGRRRGRIKTTVRFAWGERKGRSEEVRAAARRKAAGALVRKERGLDTESTRSSVRRGLQEEERRKREGMG